MWFDNRRASIGLIGLAVTLCTVSWSIASSFATTKYNCSGVCTGTIYCGSAELACCCRPRGVVAYTCVCKAASACENSNAEICTEANNSPTPGPGGEL